VIDAGHREMKQNFNLRGFALILLLTIAALVYLTPVMLTGNFLWFIPVFDTEAERIIVYRGGEQITLYPDDPGFDEVNTACNALISKIEAVYATFGISDSGLEQLRAQGTAVELFYAEPLDFPSPVNLGGPNQLLFPLSEYYTEDPVAIRGFDGEYWGAALRVGDLRKLQAVVAALEH
jgi:hypothetical protein